MPACSISLLKAIIRWTVVVLRRDLESLVQKALEILCFLPSERRAPHVLSTVNKVCGRRTLAPFDSKDLDFGLAVCCALKTAVLTALELDHKSLDVVAIRGFEPLDWNQVLDLAIVQTLRYFVDLVERKSSRSP